MQLSVTDLDALFLLIRNRASRQYAEEALRALRGGAYRAAIVATWIATAFDLISKIREMAVDGEANAAAYVKALDAAILSQDVPKLLKLEASLIADSGTTFALLAPHQVVDLERLRDDRHLCAHPAFVDESVLFEPDPERVRFHFANAINFVLSQPPVQGKTAIARIVAEIGGLAFPRSDDDIEAYLYGKYLGRSRDTLVRNLVIVLIAQLLGGPGADLASKHELVNHSLKAIQRRTAAAYEGAMPDALRKHVGPTEAQVAPLCALLSSDTRIWDWLETPKQIAFRALLESYAEHADTTPLAALPSIARLAEFSPLSTQVLTLFETIDKSGQEAMLKGNPRARAFIPRALALYSEADGYREAELLGRHLIVPLAGVFTDAEVDLVLNAVSENRQIREAARTIDTLLILYENHPNASWAAFLEVMKENHRMSFSSLRAVAGEEEAF